MISPEIKKAFVRIICNGKVLGNGFVAAPGYVVTCAHVVRACGLDPEMAATDEASGLEVGFHWLAEKPVFAASLAERGWRYKRGSVDIAVLKLNAGVLSRVTPLRLASLTRHAFKAELEPYIPVIDGSRRIEAEVDGQDENGRMILVAVDPSRQWIDAGVSGSAVLGLNGELVEGIVMRDDIEVKQAFVCPAPLIQEVLDEVERAMVAPASPAVELPTAVCAPPSRPTAAGDRSPDVFADFLGNDPVAGDDAIEPMAARGVSIVHELLERASTRQHIVRMRKLCARIGHDAIEPLIEAIRLGPWQKKLAAAPCFAAFQDGSANHDLYNLLKLPDFDVQRLAIEATGHAGYSSNIRWELVRLAKYDNLQREHYRLDDYSFGKLFTYVVEALGRGFARRGDVDELRHLNEFFDFCYELRQGDAVNALERSFEDLSPAAADALISDWIPQKEGPYARLALAALGKLRLRRAALAAVPSLFDTRDEVSYEAAACLGNTGDDATACTVSEALGSGKGCAGAALAVSMLYARAENWSLADGFVEAALLGTSEVAAQMLVSVAQRDPDMVLERARQGLHHSDPFYRGASAIAIAWARPPDTDHQLREADDEASNELERLFIVTAQILSGRFDRGAALHTVLGEVKLWQLIRPFWRCQVLAALSLSDLDARYARCWAEISRDNAPRFQALVAQYARRAAPERVAAMLREPSKRHSRHERTIQP